MPKARTPGLWMVDGGDEKQVLDAMKHLLTLLDDPYYYEAYQRLLRVKNNVTGEINKHPKLLGRKGRISNEIGSLARSLQEGMSIPPTTKRNGPGRPPDELIQLLKVDEFRRRIESIPGSSLKVKCLNFVQSCRGENDEQTAKWTDWLYSKVRSKQRNAKQ